MNNWDNACMVRFSYMSESAMQSVCIRVSFFFEDELRDMLQESVWRKRAAVM